MQFFLGDKQEKVTSRILTDLLGGLNTYLACPVNTSNKYRAAFSVLPFCKSTQPFIHAAYTACLVGTLDTQCCQLSSFLSQDLLCSYCTRIDGKQREMTVLALPCRSIIWEWMSS